MSASIKATGVQAPSSGHQLSIALEMTALGRPGADRGLGRYVTTVREALCALGHTVSPVALRTRDGRLSEFIDVVDRRRALHRLSYDVFHATNTYTVAGPVSARSVTSVHDLIPIEVRTHRRTGVKAHFFHRLASHADAILTLSQYSAERITALLGVPANRIVVAPLPPRPIFCVDGSVTSDREAIAQLGVVPPYFIAVADLRRADPRKRVEWLDAVGKGLATDGKRLVVVGDGTDSQSPAAVGWYGTGRVSDATLAALFRQATALVYTSAYEGQGLPPLEALACGTPVVAMANTAIPEVVGDAGILIDERSAPHQAGNGPHRADDPGCQPLVDACRALARDSDLRRSLAERAPTQAGRFSLDRFTSALARAYG